MPTVPFVLLVFATFVTLAAICANLVILAVFPAIEPWPPRWRAHFLLLVAAAPWLVGASVLLSSLGDIAFGACSAGDACLWNEDAIPVDPVRALVVLPLVAAMMILSIKAARQFWLARRIIAALDTASIGQGEETIRIVPSDAPLAIASHRHVYVSQGLARRLSPEQYRAVLLHERAHLERRDGFYRGAAAILSACYVPPLRRRLLSAFLLATEEACDEAAASEVGREMTASAILAVERLAQRFSPPQLQGFAENFVPIRVAKLLELGPNKDPDSRLLIIVIVSILLGFLFADFLYYLTMLILYPDGVS